jgi:hypothetical protein
VKDAAINDPALHARIIARSKQLLSYEGITHPNGVHEDGLDVARYINAFPGTPGDYRAWIGGIRPVEDITALLDNMKYAYHRAKIVVLEEELAKARRHLPCPGGDLKRTRKDDPNARLQGADLRLRGPEVRQGRGARSFRREGSHRDERRRVP